MIALVRGVILRATSAGSMFIVSRSMSANTGVAPSRAIGSAGAEKVKAGQMTSSPGPTPSALSTSVIASVPLPQPTACATPRCAAASLSNALTFGPRMNCPDSSTSAKRAFSSSASGEYWALTSIGGILGIWARQFTHPPPAKNDQGDEDDENGHHGVVHVVETVLHFLPASAQREPDRLQREA